LKYFYDRKINKATLKNIRPEDELLLCCARTYMDSETTKCIKELLGKTLDWQYLLHNAFHHGIMQLLYWQLKETYPEAVPKDKMNQLKKNFKANSKCNLFLTVKLLKLLNLFKENNIIAIPYKGPIQAALAYGDPLLRQSSDLDILLREQDVLEAKELLVSQGYRPVPNLTKNQEIVLLKYLLEHTFIHNEDRIVIDVHWRIAPKYFMFPIDYEKLWERLKPISLLGREVMTFSPEDLLLILCIHGIRNSWEYLYLICDIAKLIHVYQEMDWNWVLSKSKRFGNKRFLFLGLYLANDILGSKIPKKILQKVKTDKVVASVASHVYKRLFCETCNSPNILEKSLLQLKLKEHLKNKIQYSFQLMIMVLTTDCKFLHLPPFLNFICYLLQPIRLCLQHRLNLMKKYKSISNQSGKLYSK